MENDVLPENWNEDEIDDTKTTKKELGELVVSSRDWTVETIFSQIDQDNINLNPAFQRRNAWDDKKRSKLIESLITGLPIPEIVLAEDPNKKSSFIVIDGKQRLLTIAGFISPEKYKYWDKPILKELTVRADLNGYDFASIKEKYPDDYRMLNNSSIRCMFITNFHKTDVLYDIFYRLNTGSVLLSTQELRQVLYKGAFADYLINITNVIQPIHQIMGLAEPDKRLRDAEMILRFFSIELLGKNYKNNLRKFLDDSMGTITKEWDIYKTQIDALYKKLNKAITLLIDTLGDKKYVGRRYGENGWEVKFNKVLFEAEAYYFIRLSELKHDISTKGRTAFITEFQKLCKDPEFQTSIEVSTKDNIRYFIRFTKLRDAINHAFNVDISEYPISEKVISNKK